LEISLGTRLAQDVKKDGKTLFKKDTILKQFEAKEIENAGIEEVEIFTPLTCKTRKGLCQKCYGLDMGRGEIIKMGEAVGIVAAQAIGEPGTQLTMRTFHSGGVAGVDITQGLPRVEELFERRMPKSQEPATIASFDGEVVEVVSLGNEKKISLLLNEGEKTKKGKTSVELPVGNKRVINVKVGDRVHKGQILTDGSADLEELFEYAGIERTQDYIAEEVTKVYELQGASISRKHMEVIIRQMFSRSQIVDAGDTRFTEGDVVPTDVVALENQKMREQSLAPAGVRRVVMGITNVALSTDSWISAASFQNTTRVLIKAAIRGASDKLNGLKENVTVGRLIPAGTGYDVVDEVSEEETSEAK
jgi:DNA-directed RNA polymerase subunit beta'